MLGLLGFILLAGCASAQKHHLYVGLTGGAYVHALEFDDAARTIYEMGIIPAAGASPSLALDNSKKFLFASDPTSGKLTRYAVQEDYSLKNEGSAEIPASCNTTKFTSLHLSPASHNPSQIFGAASTGVCSTLFSTSVTGFHTLRSKEFAGDIRSLAWSPNGRQLHALDSRSSSSAMTSIFNFYIAEDPNLESLNHTDTLANVTNAEQIIAHPTGNMFYIVTKDTNELVTVPLVDAAADNADAATAALARYKLLPSSIDASLYTTSSLTISSSNSFLWTLSQSGDQAIITVFSLDPATGAVISSVVRAAWQGLGGIGWGQLSPAPFKGSDVIAVSNSPMGMVAFLGLDQGTVPAGAQGTVQVEADDFLIDVEMLNVQSEAAAAPKLKSFGRIDLGLDDLGQGVWVD